MQFGTSCSLNHDTTTSFGSTLPHLHRCYSKVGSTGPTTAYEGSNTSYTSNMDVGCSLGPLAASTMTPQHHLAPRYPTCTGVTVRLDPQAQPQHMNVLKHFIYIQYGCGMQTARVCSLNHDITLSLGPHLTAMLQNWNWAPHLDIMCNSLRVHPYAHPPRIKVLNTWHTYI